MNDSTPNPRKLRSAARFDNPANSTATLSFSDGFRTEEGDVFEIEAQPFALARNPLARAAAATPVKVLSL
jgi:hypothetical protein